MDHISLPLVSMESLTALEHSLEGQTALSRGFVSRYVEMWPARHARLSQAIAAGQWEEAVESALSLYSSSTMVGAERLGQMSGDLVETIKRGQHGQAREALAAVGRCGDATVIELTVRYVQAV